MFLPPFRHGFREQGEVVRDKYETVDELTQLE